MSLITGPNSQPNPNKPDIAAGGGSKIIVDSDWKSQAQAEKEKLNAQAQAAAQAKAAQQGPAGGRDPNEPIGIQDLVSILVNQALMYMGGMADPRTGKVVVALEYAKVYVDLLGVIDQKTKGNLTPEEETMVKNVTHELRLEFVEVSNAIAKAVEEGKISPTQMGGGQGGPGGSAPSFKLAQPGQGYGPKLTGPGL